MTMTFNQIAESIYAADVFDALVVNLITNGKLYGSEDVVPNAPLSDEEIHVHQLNFIRGHLLMTAFERAGVSLPAQFRDLAPALIRLITLAAAAGLPEQFEYITGECFSSPWSGSTDAVWYVPTTLAYQLENDEGVISLPIAPDHLADMHACFDVLAEIDCALAERVIDVAKTRVDFAWPA